MQLRLRTSDQEVSPRDKRRVYGRTEGTRIGGVGWRAAIVGIIEDGRVGNLIRVAVVDRVSCAFMMRRSRSWASLANMLVEFGLERLHEFLQIL